MPKYFVTAHADDIFSQVVSAHSEDEATEKAMRNSHRWRLYQDGNVVMDARLITD